MYLRSIGLIHRQYTRPLVLSSHPALRVRHMSAPPDPAGSAPAAPAPGAPDPNSKSAGASRAAYVFAGSRSRADRLPCRVCSGVL